MYNRCVTTKKIMTIVVGLVVVMIIMMVTIMP